MKENKIKGRSLLPIEFMANFILVWEERNVWFSWSLDVTKGDFAMNRRTIICLSGPE